ncbi:hypothetical protein BFW88_13480 [Pseudomonas fluorescens]|nr:hypothetical protein BFW88_13480 [Pseudomonas fluorescens]OPB09240.1 hypothetical protein BFW92_13675 [Pseudomonas fluorescens]OPB21087.1 hypothetical protein BFW93_13465 [Pseudomonas fluorescens]
MSPDTEHLSDDAHFDLSEPQRLFPQYFVPPRETDGVLTPHYFASVPFQELDLYIPGITSAEGFDGGINKAALDVHRDDGLLCYLLPYLDMTEGDFIELFCNDTVVPVAIYNVKQDDIDKNRIIPLYIPRTRLTDGPANPVFMRVTRISGNRNETRRFSLWVDTVRPAGRNPVASTLQNENLAIPGFPQTIIDFGVTETDAQNGVPVTFRFYPVDDTQAPNTFRAARDRIRFSVGGVYADIQPVTEAQAAGREDITVVLYHGFWQQVRSGSHVCEYEVVDEVGNASQGWSPAQLLNVRLNDGGELWLPEPSIDEVPENTLDYDALDADDATFRVPIRGNGYAVGDVINIKVNGRGSDGAAIVKAYPSQPLISATVNFLTLPFPNADIHALVGGRFQLSYERIRAGVPNRGSEAIIIEVTGTPIETGLRAPEVIDAVGGVLDPRLLTVTVNIPVYDGRDPFDLVTLILDGTYANGDRYYKELKKSAGTAAIRFPITNGPDGDIAGLEGGTLRFIYKVTNADGPRTSLDTTVNVGSPVASLPEPEVQEAPAPQYQFDPSVSTDDATVLVIRNPDFKEGDTVVLHCEGTAAGGTQPPVRFPILKHWVGEDLPFTLLRQYILPNLNQSMRIYYTREREHALTRFSHSVNMGVGVRLKLDAPTVVDATVIGEDIASLNPLHVLPPRPPVVTIRVVADHLPPSADIKLFITGKSGIGMPDIPAKPARPEPGQDYVSFSVPNAFVAAYLGGQCTVFYDLIELGKTSKSDDLTLKVEALSEQLLDVVSVPEAQNGQIAANHTNNVRISQWPFFRQSQPVFITLKSSHDLPLRPGIIVSSDEFTAKRTLDLIPSSYLQSLAEGNSLTVNARVSLDGMDNSDTAISLVPASYSIKNRPEIIATIPLSRTPISIAITSNNKLYIIGRTLSDIYRNDVIFVYDIATQRLIATLNNTGNAEISTSHDGNRAFTARNGSPSSGTIEILRTGDQARLKTIFLGDNISCTDSFSSFNGSKLFTATRSIYNNQLYNNILVHDLSSYARTRSIAMGATHITKFFTNSDRSIVYFTMSTPTGHILGRLDPVNESYLGNTPGLGGTPQGASFHHSRERAYYTTAGRVGILNPKLNTVIAGGLSGFTNAYGIACHPFINQAYVSDTSLHTVSIIDTSSDTLQKVQTLSGFHGPQTVLASPDGKYVIVANVGGNSISVIKT